jgi:hypothetical protein
VDSQTRQHIDGAEISHFIILHRTLCTAQITPSWAHQFHAGRYAVTGELAMWMVVYVATVALLSFAFIPALTIDE